MRASATGTPCTLHLGDRSITSLLVQGQVAQVPVEESCLGRGLRLHLAFLVKHIGAARQPGDLHEAIM